MKYRADRNFGGRNRKKPEKRMENETLRVGHTTAIARVRKDMMSRKPLHSDGQQGVHCCQQEHEH